MKGNCLRFRLWYTRKPIRDITGCTADCGVKARAVNIYPTAPRIGAGFEAMSAPFIRPFMQTIQRFETLNYIAMKRLQAIWSEGAFAVLKQEHKLKRARKRYLERVSEECLLSAVGIGLETDGESGGKAHRHAVNR